jgi:hypothetical protein
MPTARAGPSSKHHLITGTRSILHAGNLTGVNRNDVSQLQALVEDIPPKSGKCGSSQLKPRVVQGDRAMTTTNLGVPVARGRQSRRNSLDVVSLTAAARAKHVWVAWRRKSHPATLFTDMRLPSNSSLR